MPLKPTCPTILIFDEPHVLLTGSLVISKILQSRRLLPSARKSSCTPLTMNWRSCSLSALRAMLHVGVSSGGVDQPRDQLKMDEDQVENKFCCPICFQLFKRPTQLPCWHRLCARCLKELLKQSDQCPVCRTQFTRDRCVRDNDMEKVIDSELFLCRGCKQQCPLIDYNTHIATCQMRETVLPPPITDPPIETVNRSTYHCPICHAKDLDCVGLVQHCNNYHAHERMQVVCPVCASMPWGDPTQVSSNFLRHLNLRHQFEYDTFVDYHQDEDSSLQTVLEASRTDK